MREDMLEKKTLANKEHKQNMISQTKQKKENNVKTEKTNKM